MTNVISRKNKKEILFNIMKVNNGKIIASSHKGRKKERKKTASTKANNKHYYCLTFIVSDDKCGCVVFVGLQRF